MCKSSLKTKKYQFSLEDVLINKMHCATGIACEKCLGCPEYDYENDCCGRCGKKLP